MCVNACGKLPSSRFGAGSYSSASRPTSLRSASSRSNSASRLVRAARQRVVVGEPERAGEEHALAGRQPVDVSSSRAIAEDESVLQRSSLDRLARCRRTRGSSAGRKPTSGIISRLASSSLRAVVLGERARARRRSPRAQTSAWISSRTARQRSTGPSSPNCSTPCIAAVERDPGHHLRVGEVPARAAHLPDALVGLVPAPSTSSSSSTCWSAQPRIVRRDAVRARLVQRVDDLAVDVELELLGGGVADAHRPRALVAGQPVDLPLGQPPLARDAVHDLQLVGIAGGGPQQPVAPGRRPRRRSRRSGARSSVSVASRSQQ